ncbi:MAG: serine/threonine protein kinase, partial [Sphingomonadaceae bacterium]
MSKAYSNKALPVGTVLREWRLEDVIGVGGFGIVYRGRGIYFDELVAIKEYFPSAISEREEDDTVVPVDSDAEEVHALGLKKFVEEAKLLWNLSTPSRPPNIVSVRSLFEIHGTAYMVMDFEDGQSLSKQLKDGKKFDEGTLSNVILPIAEGLERAHRVGVLHRDIKPANIIVREDGSAVLIDFGSARFESGDATSTKVTFHTPPYAAIEQYVKTYDQGPWTDIYALGVVLYECVTGEKPLEVLERMHGEDDTPLAQRDLPGYSQDFLKAIDAAMVIRPGDRPQSVARWLRLFSGAIEPNDDGEATRVAPMMDDPHEIQPVLPAPDPDPVPDAPEDATFKMDAGETRAGLYAQSDGATEESDGPSDAAADVPPADDSDPTQADLANAPNIDDMAGEALGSGPDRSDWKKKPALPWPTMPSPPAPPS